MNIQLNVTLIVQIIHFVVAYILIRYLVLKPAMALIDEQERQREQIRDLISYNYILIDREKSAVHNQWQQERKAYERQEGSLIVDPNMLFLKDIYPTQERVHMSPETTQLLIKSATQELIGRVKK